MGWGARGGGSQPPNSLQTGRCPPARCAHNNSQGLQNKRTLTISSTFERRLSFHTLVDPPELFQGLPKYISMYTYTVYTCVCGVHTHNENRQV